AQAVSFCKAYTTPSWATTVGQTYQLNESACHSSLPLSGSKPSTFFEPLTTSSVAPGTFTSTGLLHEDSIPFCQTSLPVFVSRASRAWFSTLALTISRSLYKTGEVPLPQP